LLRRAADSDVMVNPSLPKSPPQLCAEAGVCVQTAEICARKMPAIRKVSAHRMREPAFAQILGK
jgi:hypothetical protein